MILFVTRVVCFQLFRIWTNKNLRKNRFPHQLKPVVSRPAWKADSTSKVIQAFDILKLSILWWISYPAIYFCTSGLLIHQEISSWPYMLFWYLFLKCIYSCWNLWLLLLLIYWIAFDANIYGGIDISIYDLDLCFRYTISM